MKVWLLYDDGGCYPEGPRLRAVCTSLESVTMVKAECDAIANMQHEVVESETDKFWVSKEYGWLEDLSNEPIKKSDT